MHSRLNDSTSSIGTTHGSYASRNGRRYLRGTQYPLPIDLQELHRQNLQTLLMQTVFGKALCSPVVEKQPPQAVLEVACGSAFWSAACHDYLAELGCLNVSFTGVDIAPLAPDYRQHGMNWRFVEHDIRQVPFPFVDGAFDLIVLKDLCLSVQTRESNQQLIDEALRLLRPGGVLEIWETDQIIRSILPHALSLPNPQGDLGHGEELRQALSSAVFEISPATPFGPVQNQFLEDFNTWMQQITDQRKLGALPCPRMQPMLIQETENLFDVGFRRLAIPLGEMPWEEDDEQLIAARQWAVARARVSRQTPNDNDGFDGAHYGDQDSILTYDQVAIRQTALAIVTQLIESLEPLLREVSGKNEEEWQRWWNWMIEDLQNNGGATSGACLEIGAFWARKK